MTQLPLIPAQTNLQPSEKLIRDPKMPLEVFKVWLTLQGEGPFAGTKAVFVRLSGCTVTCPGCDTDYTSNRKHYSNFDLVFEVGKLMGSGLVVITGGEPFRQNISGFVRELLYTERYTVQIETNGSVFAPDLLEFPFFHEDLSLVVSPKTPKLAEEVVDHAKFYKYVIRSTSVSPEDGLPTRVLGRECEIARPPKWIKRQWIFVQPEDQQDEVRNRENLKACVNSVMKFGYRLSLQSHKAIGLE
jgi:7-carboxy-7-deazaguanine synthase